MNVFDQPRSRFLFGRSVRFAGTLNVPPVPHADQVAEDVVGNLLVSLTLWSLAHKCFDTTKGLVSFWFVNATDATGISYPLMVGHWSLWKTCMVQLYTGWWHACTKPMMQQAFRPYVVQNLELADYDELVKVTGVDPFTTEKRRKEEGLFCISAHWFRYAVEAIGAFTFDDLFTECKNHQCKKQDMQQVFNISTYKMVHRSPQAKVSAAAIRGINPKGASTYDELSFNFGVPCSRAQLELLHSVPRNWYNTNLPLVHFRSLFDTADTEPVLTYAQLQTSFRGGPKDDSKVRPHADRNFARARDRKLEASYRRARGLPKARKGRPRKTPESRDAQLKIQKFRELNKRRRRKKKKKRDDEDEEVDSVPVLKRPRVKAYIPTKDGRRVPLTHTMAPSKWGLMRPVVAKVLKSAPLPLSSVQVPAVVPPSVKVPAIKVPAIKVPAVVPPSVTFPAVVPHSVKVPLVTNGPTIVPYGMGDLLNATIPVAFPATEAPSVQNAKVVVQKRFTALLQTHEVMCPSDDEWSEFQGESSDENESEWETTVAPPNPLYTSKHQAGIRKSLLSLT